jgi:RHS repeat-associated protein
VDGTTGQKIAEFSYGPFGELLSATGPRADGIKFRFGTKYADEETGFIYYGDNYYDPKTRTWLSKDRRREGGDGPNYYAFLKNNPLGHWDAIGMTTDKPIYIGTAARAAARRFRGRWRRQSCGPHFAGCAGRSAKPQLYSNGE